MLRPGSCVRPAGGSPVRVDTGVPGSRPQSVVERWRAERGVEGLFGGSKFADRSIKRILQPRQRDNEGAEPLMSRRRPRPAGPVPGSARRVPPGYGERYVDTVWHGTGETRLRSLTSGEDRSYKPVVKSGGAQRESDGVVVPRRAAGQHNLWSGKGPDFGHGCRGGTRKGMTAMVWSNHPGRCRAVAAHRGADG